MALEQGEHAHALLGDFGGEAEGAAHLGERDRDFFPVIDDEGKVVTGRCHWSSARPFQSVARRS
jgi:hypothetical protein